MSFEIEVNGGSSVRLPTAGKYCDRDIIVTATGGGGGDTEAAYNEGFADGKQAQDDAFWDAFQQNGTRTNYQYAFAYNPWTDEIFKPKYPLQPTNAERMFFNCQDLVMQSTPLSVDFSKATNVTWAFRNATKLVRLGKCDFSSTTGASGVFSFCYALKEIEEIVSHANLTWDASFPYCYALESVKISGVIGKNGFDISHCEKLNKASIDSIINALSTTTSGLSITLSKTAVDAISAAEGENYGDYLSSLKPNWTINLV